MSASCHPRDSQSVQGEFARASHRDFYHYDSEEAPTVESQPGKQITLWVFIQNLSKLSP